MLQGELLTGIEKTCCQNCLVGYLALGSQTHKLAVMTLTTSQAFSWFNWHQIMRFISRKALRMIYYLSHCKYCFFATRSLFTSRWRSNTSVHFPQAGLLTGDEVVAPPREALVRIHYLIQMT